MDVFALTRAFIDIESVTGNELAIGQYFHDYLKPLADKHGGQAERIEVEKDRYNVYAHWGRPEIVWYEGGHCSFSFHPEVRTLVERVVRDRLLRERGA